MMRFRELTLLSTAFAALCTAQPAAAPAKEQPPVPGPPPSFSFPQYETRKLSNGLTVFVVEDHRQPVVSYWLAVDAGAIRNEPNKAGLADMTVTMLRNGGTKTRTSQEIAKLVDTNGGSLSGSISQDAAMVQGTWLKPASQLGLELMADIVLNPVFDEKELERMRQQALSGLQIAFTSPESLIDMAAPRVVLGQNSYAYPESGTPETVRGLKREDLVTFHRTYYVPAGAYLSIAGDITPAVAVAQAEKFFGKWTGPAPAAVKMAATPALERRVVIIDKPDAPQSRIFVGEVAIPRNHPDYIPLLLANEALGGAYTSRLNLKLRATEGLTYNASSALQTMRLLGAFAIQTFTRTEKTAEALRQILAVQRGFAELPVTEAELADAKARIIGSFQLSTEAPEAVAQRLLIGAVNGLPAGYYNDFTKRVAATSVDQVNATAKKYLHPDKSSIVVVGKADAFAKELASLGPVKTINASDFDPIAPDLTRPAPSTPAATAETTAEGKQKIEAAAKAVGGAEALRTIKSLSSKATVVLKSPQGEMKAESSEEILFPDKFRVMLKLPVGELIQVYDGTNFWIKQGAMVRQMPPGMIAEAQRTIRTAGAIGLLRDALDGKAEVQAIDEDGVLWTQNDVSVKMYFDPQTHRVSKLVYHSSGMAGPVEMEHTMADYRPVGNIQLPFRETLIQGGEPAGERNFTDRQVNVDLSPTLFEKPAQ